MPDRFRPMRLARGRIRRVARPRWGVRRCADPAWFRPLGVATAAPPKGTGKEDTARMFQGDPRHWPIHCSVADPGRHPGAQVGPPGTRHRQHTEPRHPARQPVSVAASYSMPDRFRMRLARGRIRRVARPRWGVRRCADPAWVHTAAPPGTGKEDTARIIPSGSPRHARRWLMPCRRHPGAQVGPPGTRHQEPRHPTQCRTVSACASRAGELDVSRAHVGVCGGVRIWHGLCRPRKDTRT